MQTKICTKCGEEKELGEFHKNKSNKDGLSCGCKLCKRLCKRSLSNQYYAKHKESITERSRFNAERKNARAKIYYTKNAEMIKERSRKYYSQNAEVIKIKKRKYHKEAYLQRRKRICQGKPKTQKELITMFRMTLRQTEKATRTGNHEALLSLRAKYEQLATMAG
jgi:hypothetical protein